MRLLLQQLEEAVTAAQEEAPGASQPGVAQRGSSQGSQGERAVAAVEEDSDDAPGPSGAQADTGVVNPAARMMREYEARCGQEGRQASPQRLDDATIEELESRSPAGRLAGTSRAAKASVDSARNSREQRMERTSRRSIEAQKARRGRPGAQG